jgi:two-component system LytT family response regulator
MNPIRTLIVDDEPLARDRLRTLLVGDPDIVLIGECEDGQQALAALRAGPCDLAFLDVQMPGLDGLGVMRALDTERVPAVIFVTAHDCYALPAFEVQAVDYLLKPFDRERFERALSRAKERIAQDRSARAGQELLTLLQVARPERSYLDRLLIRSSGRIYFLKVEEIDWVEAAGNYVRLHAGRTTHLLRETLGSLEAKLDPSRFVRIHRSTMVNVERIRELEPLFHGDYTVVLADGTHLPLSRTYRAALSGLLGHEL